MATSTSHRDIKWVEGLRGIAAVFIVISHLTQAFWETFFWAAASQDNAGSWLRLPFLRLPFAQKLWLAAFFLLTGYVNAYKPIKEARKPEGSISLIGLASSAFRRPWRLVLPTVFMTVIAWMMTQLGFFDLGRRCAAYWMRDTSPEISPTWPDAVYQLLRSILNTWKGTANAYDKNQWCMYDLLKGSMLIYIVMLATVKCAPRYRMFILFILFLYSYSCQDILLGSNIYYGAFLAELSMEASSFSKSQNAVLCRRILVFTLLIFGLFVAGFPDYHWELASWSRGLVTVGTYIFPMGSEQHRYWPSIGTQAVTLSLVLSQGLQRLLSHPFLCWLGSISFPAYLIHGSLIRSLLVWMLFGFRAPIGLYQKNFDKLFYEEWEVHLMPEPWMYWLAIPVFFIVLGILSHCWNILVEPWCAYITLKAEEKMCPQLAEGQRKMQMLDKGLPNPNGVVR